MVMLRPSCFGVASTVPSSLTSSASRCSSRNPSSGRDCSRPRNMMVTLTLFPPSRKRTHVALLGLVVMGVDLRAELLLLDHRELLVAAGLPGLLRALVLELAVVHELADRGAGGGSDLDEVELGLLRQPQGVLDAHDADLLAVRADQADLGHADAVVDARFCADADLLVSTSWRDGAETRRSGATPRHDGARRIGGPNPDTWGAGWEPGLHLIALTRNETHDRVVAFRRVPVRVCRTETGGRHVRLGRDVDVSAGRERRGRHRSSAAGRSG